MREILFRGKRVDNGEWITGSLLVSTIEENGKTYKSYKISDIIYGVFPNDFMSGIEEYVTQSTIGQYTGLNDKNGEKIFEGDVVLVDEFEKYTVCFKQERNGFFPFACGDGCGCCEIETVNPKYQSIEVMGNIQDNPELIKER